MKGEPSPMKLAIAEDSAILRLALSELLTGRGHTVAIAAREREALELTAQGRSNAAIGQALHVSLGTVEKYVSAIFTKLCLAQADGDHRRVLAVLHYLGVSQLP
ncbi:regulatory protein, luxR family [Micrococcales bacterium KH10]|nr:regulatory protein, luxR family [Micrococcales bacterium KH10]